MHITKIELENIKSHVNSTFEFTRGTTAITGENGAGKTTLIEAVAWTLFDLLEYKKEDFVRRGAKKGFARITFESGLDEREYVVYRDSGAGYYVEDPRLQTRIANKKEEVFRFLWQHLGLEPGTDLKSLFRQAIGVPQGTFTAIFLEGTTERKVAFDRLLKVEEYRQAAEKLRETSRFVENSITAVREDIARAEGELTRSESTEEEHRSFAEQSLLLSANIELLKKDIVVKQKLVKKRDAAERKSAELQAAFDRLQAERSKTDFVLQQREIDVNQASAAADKIAAVKADHERYLEILARLKDLERERRERDKLRAELAKVEAALVNVNADQKRLQENLENAQKAHREIQTLKPKAVEQERLEKEIHASRNQAANAKAIGNQITSLDEKMTRLRESYKANQAQLREAEAKAATGGDLATLEKRDSELLRQIAGLRASLDRDQKFQSEIRNGLCPILSQKCLNLKPGETLEGFVLSQFSELKSQIGTLETEHEQVAVGLGLAREAERFSEALESFRQREKELAADGKRLADEKQELQKHLERLPEIEEQLTMAEAKLKALDDPKAGIRFFENEAAREIELREGVTKIESNLERLESERQLLVEQLDSYKDLDERWANLSDERDRTAEAHRVFLTNEALAKSLTERKTQLELAQKEVSRLQAELAEAEQLLGAAGKGYDREQHQAEKAALLEAEKRHAETRATFDAVKRREDQLAVELKRFAEIRKSLRKEFKEKERLEKIAEATTFIRDTLKEAAPRVARNYVYHVSLEANQMFREITGNAEHTLKWAEDYAILLEEDGFERPFASLSGGEQMAAALSVRLALLKQLTDIRIAFFDEPTTNMDAERRENLAMQISRITHFDQLFVISHDDTFEGYVDNVISIGD